MRLSTLASQHAAKCSESDTNSSKGKLLGNRKGENWKLTAETTGHVAGELYAEYILDGTRIKLETSDAERAAAAVTADIEAWNPSAVMANPRVDVEDSAYNPWRIKRPTTAGGALTTSWGMQNTAALPLEAIHDLFRKAVSGEASPLLRETRSGSGMQYVTRDFFRTNPNGISTDNVKDDMLGFLSIVMSYAKGAMNPPPGTSPKQIMSIMPRTDFTHLFEQIKNHSGEGSLYDLLKILACYRDRDGEIELDQTWCKGTLDAPEPNDQMDQQKFNGDRGPTVPEWIQSIQDGKKPNLLSEADKQYDGSIGGLKGALENVIGTDRAVPIFEFRNLASTMPTGMEKGVKGAKDALIEYHRKFGSSPTTFERRSLRSVVSKRQDDECQVEDLRCKGLDNTYWMRRDSLNNHIPTFCQEAETQGVQDQDSGNIRRSYDQEGVDAVTLTTGWPSGSSFKPSKDECIAAMSIVMDSCDGNDPANNPFNWKHGGSNRIGEVKYTVTPNTQRYKAGTCSFHLHQRDEFEGADWIGSERTHTYYLRVEAKDADGNVVANVDNDVEASATNPLSLEGYYGYLVMTPQSQANGDYIQFALGSQMWKSSDGEGSSSCRVGDWDGDFSPVGRDMDCVFRC
ncbi:MAG: hypothetical protein Q9169_004117 [Polycauliona sp. 2 TL-2023]